MQPSSLRPLTITTFALLVCTGVTCVPSFSDQTEPQASADGQSTSSKSAVRAWFEKYDHIRRSAEMTMGEKLQCRGLLEKGLSHAVKEGDRHKTLAQKMVAKYGAAATAMQSLSKLPETAELQDGYVEFFNKGRQLFEDCLGSDAKAPATGDELEQSKKSMETLDKKIKKIDEELRKKYSVPRHRHI